MKESTGSKSVNCLSYFVHFRSCLSCAHSGTCACDSPCYSSLLTVIMGHTHCVCVPEVTTQAAACCMSNRCVGTWLSNASGGQGHLKCAGRLP